MYLIFGRRIIEKDVLAAFFSFLVGLVSTLWLIFNVVYFFGFAFILEQFTKITCQSNLFAFIVSTMYVLNPNRPIFKTNFLPLFAICLLWFAGLGFWFILFPVYYLDLGDLLFSSSDLYFKTASTVFALWNHAVTQIFFLVFFYYINKKKNIWQFEPVSTKTMMNVMYTYLIAWMIWNVIISWIDRVWPTYGIFTNFNPYKWVESSDKSKLNIFSLRALLYSHISCVLLAFVIVIMFSSVSIKFKIAHYYSESKTIIKVPTKKLADVF